MGGQGATRVRNIQQKIVQKEQSRLERTPGVHESLDLWIHHLQWITVKHSALLATRERSRLAGQQRKKRTAQGDASHVQ
jgi:hypothetical protein